MTNSLDSFDDLPHYYTVILYSSRHLVSSICTLLSLLAYTLDSFQNFHSISKCHRSYRMPNREKDKTMYRAKSRQKNRLILTA